MSVKVRICDETGGDEAHIYDYLREQATLSERGLTLGVTHPKDIFATFASASRSAAGTTILTQPPLGGSVILTDLIVSAERRTSGLVTLQFTDGTNTVPIYVGQTNDAPINLALSLQGRVRGWEDARLELVTNNVVATTVTTVYIKASQALNFSAWDKER